MACYGDHLRLLFKVFRQASDLFTDFRDRVAVFWHLQYPPYTIVSTIKCTNWQRLALDGRGECGFRGSFYRPSHKLTTTRASMPSSLAISSCPSMLLTFTCT